MTNINVQVVGTANLGQMSKQFAALNAQVMTLNSQLAAIQDHSQAVDPRGYQNLAKAASLNSKIWRDAVASTGMFQVQQVQLNSATDEYIKKLNAQKMGFRELMRTRKIAHAAYREQLAMESMLVRKAPSGTRTSKEIFDVAIPNRFDDSLNTAANRLAFMNEQLKSGARQMVNWGKNTQWAGRQLMVGFTIPLAAFGAAAGVMAYRLDSEMTRVRKVYDTTANSASAALSDQIAVTKELEQVTAMATATAVESAKQYGQAATDTIAVQAELAATGKTGLELQQNTLQVMRIARLGEIEHQTATEATIALQSIFRMSNEELAESFNYMNAVENATSLSTADFAEAIPVAASAVKAWGGDIKELGILLTAMKENGIGASEGANAIKATMQRLARPSKQIREEFQALTGVNIMDITENADGLIDVFTQINEVTADLSESDRRKAFAGLFGSYQVSRMMALTKGMGELQEGVGQVSDAYNIAGKDAQEWEQIAENELKQYRESISGQFKTTLENFKIQLASFGAPFVQAATLALKAVNSIMEAFNNAPSIVKWGVAIAGVMAAIAGPIVMLTGLVANMVGTGILVGASVAGGFLKLLGVMKIIPREARINALASELLEKGYMSQTKAVQGLTHELKLLTAAQAAANKASAGVVAGTANIRKSKALQAQEARIAAQERLTGHMNSQYGIMGVNKKISYHDPDTGKPLKASEAVARSQRDILAIDKRIATESTKTEKSTARMRGHLGGAAIAGGALAAGMVMTSVSSNSVVNDIGNMLILGSFVAPAAWSLAKGLGLGVKHLATMNLLTAAIGLKTKGINAMWMTSAGMKWSAALGASTSKVGAMAKFLPMMISPVTAIVAGVAAVGAGIWLWKKHMDRVAEQQAELHNNINSLAGTWADKMGLVRKEYEKITVLQRGIADKDRYETMLDAWNNGDLKKMRESFSSDDIAPDERVDMAEDIMGTLIREFDMTMAEAGDALISLYESVGLSTYDAQEVVENFKDQFGGTLGGDEQMFIQANVLFDKEKSTDEAHVAATDYGRAFAQALSEADNGDAAAALMAQFTQDINVGFDEALFEMRDHASELTDAMAAAGIDSGDALRRGIEEAGGIENFVNTMFPVEEYGRDWQLFAQQTLGQYVDPAIERTTSIMGGLTGPNSPFSFLPSNINSMTQLAAAIDGVAIMAKGVDDTRIRELLKIVADPNLRQSGMVQSMLPGMTDLEKKVYSVNEETQIAVANGLLLAGGYEQITSEAELLDFLAGKLPPKIDSAASAARRMANAFAFSGEQLGQIGEEAMEATQQQFADDYGDYMSDRYDADLQAEQDHWDQRVENVSDAGERARAGLDAAWEKKNDAAEKYWDHRVELVDKAIEAEERAEEKREKMFDAEVARIEKLNDLANANIDFNVALNEGKLDEAAKLRNDMEAGTSVEAIERARNMLSGQSEKRIDKLENKKDRIEKQRDRAMEAMKKQEEAQKASLDRQIEANQEAVQAQRDAAIKAKEEEIAAAKEADEKSIEMLMAVTSKSKKELFQRMKDAGINYKDFYRDVIKPTGDSWGKYFDKTLQTELKKSADAIANADYWETLGDKGISQMARGMGFSGKRGLMHFLETGEVKEFHENTPAKPQSKPNANDRGGDYGSGPGFHTGGMIGKDAGGRKGVARTYKGLHPSETLINAQKGEFVVNRDAAAKNEDLLRAVNDNNFKPAKHGTGGGGFGAGMGPAPFFGAGMLRGIMSKTSDKLSQAVTTKQNAMAAIAASYGSGSAYSGGLGHYSLPGVLPWVLEAANYLGGKFGITSIGGVGARAANPTSDHPKGLALDFMTGTAVDKGWALANEALRLQKVLDATYMIFQAKIHSFDDRGWQPYSHPSGATDPTSMHMDHVHLSFSPSGKAGDLPKPATIGVGNTGGGIGPPGTGGTWYRASVPGKGWANSHDYDNDYHSPIFAIGSGTVTSRVYGPNEGSGQHPNAFPRGYGSYGVTANLRTDSGVNVLAAHLWPGSVVTGRVRAGQQIAQSASTGNSSGSHTHFEVNGSENASGIFASMGIGLRKGAEFVRFDNTLANLHKGESVMTKDITSQLREGAQRFANGGGSEYTVIVNPSTGMNEEMLANKVVKKIERKERRKPVTRTVGSR